MDVVHRLEEAAKRLLKGSLRWRRARVDRSVERLELGLEIPIQRASLEIARRVARPKDLSHMPGKGVTRRAQIRTVCR
jgi:hypothetical protein